MCTWLSVSASWYFEWLKNPTSATSARRQVLADAIVVIFADADETYGYRRVHAQLQRDGVAAGPELVRKIMRELGLVACQPRPWRISLTEADGREHHIPDRLEQDFSADAPGVKLIGDITYVPTWEGWMYLATVIDCCTKTVMGYAMDDNYQTPLISAALRDATAKHELQPQAIFHSDRGSNYTSYEFAKTIADLDLRQSMGRTGICYDNAMAESFFAAYKNERSSRTVYPTRTHAMTDARDYIDNFYNPRRLHSALGYKTPQEALTEWTNNQAVA